MRRQERLQQEQAFPLAQAVNYLPQRNGKKVHYSTLYRWATKGTRGRVLATLKVGGMRYTTKNAIDDFLDGKCSHQSKENHDQQIQAIQTALDRAGV